MSVDRVATNNQSAYLTTQLLKSEATVSKYTNQVSSGKVSTSYEGIGDKTQALESARAVVARTTAYQTATTLAQTQTDLQDTQLSELSTLASDLKTAITDALANGDGSTLSATIQDTFDQVASILNSKDSNGNYLYGGGNDSSQPVTAKSLSDLTSLSSVSDAFANGSSVKSVQIADGQTVGIGVLASDVGTQLMQTLKDISSYVNTNGDFSSTLTSSQSSFLTSETSSASSAYSAINTISAENGDAYNRLKTASDTQSTMLTLYKGFVSDIEDADMTTAATNLSNAQTSLEAVAKVTASLNSISLLDYLPKS